MDFKQNNYGKFKILLKLQLLKVFITEVMKTHNYIFCDSVLIFSRTNITQWLLGVTQKSTYARKKNLRYL